MNKASVIDRIHMIRALNKRLMESGLCARELGVWFIVMPAKKGEVRSLPKSGDMLMALFETGEARRYPIKAVRVSHGVLALCLEVSPDEIPRLTVFEW